MEPALKQRLVGAAVLVALAVIFLPMLIQGPAPKSGVADVPLDAPPAPAGDYETRDLPLVAPAGTPGGSVVGMEEAPSADVAPAGTSAAGPDAAAPATGPAAPPVGTAPIEDKPAVATQPLAAAPATIEPMFPAPTAGGDFAVNFGAFSTVAAADALVAALRASQLPGYREAATVAGKTVQRVRIGPYATRAQAEAARLRAAHVRDDVGARVVMLDAAGDSATAPVKAPPAPKPATATAATPARPVPTPAQPAAAGTGFAVQVGAFAKAGDATALRDRLRAAGFSAFTETAATDKGTLTRVRVGPVLDRAEADQLKAQLKSTSGIDGIVRPHP